VESRQTDPCLLGGGLGDWQAPISAQHPWDHSSRSASAPTSLAPSRKPASRSAGARSHGSLSDASKARTLRREESKIRHYAQNRRRSRLAFVFSGGSRPSVGAQTNSVDFVLPNNPQTQALITATGMTQAQLQLF